MRNNITKLQSYIRDCLNNQKTLESQIENKTQLADRLERKLKESKTKLDTESQEKVKIENILSRVTIKSELLQSKLEEKDEEMKNLAQKLINNTVTLQEKD